MTKIIHQTIKNFGVFMLMIGMLSAQTTEEDILHIREKCNAVHQMLDSLETKKIHELKWSTEGGAVAYLKENEVTLIVAFWFGEWASENMNITFPRES